MLGLQKFKITLTDAVCPGQATVKLHGRGMGVTFVRKPADKKALSHELLITASRAKNLEMAGWKVEPVEKPVAAAEKPKPKPKPQED